MKFDVKARGWVALAMLCIAPILGACGSGSGRQGSDLVVTGTGPTEQVLGGQTVDYTMTVSNVGENDASDIKIFDSIGNQQSLVSITCSASGGAVCPATVGVSMSSPSIPRGGQLVFVVTLQLTTVARGTVTNSMSASYSDEINGSNNSFTVSATAYSNSTDLVVTGVGPGGTVTGGGALDFQMTVVNNGPDAATAVNIVNSVGNGATLTGISCLAGGGAVCPPTSVAMTADLPAGGSLTFNVSTTVAQGISGIVSNTMSANVSTDPDRSNNSFTVTANVSAASPDVGVSQTGVEQIAAGSTAVFNAVVANPGPLTASNVIISYSLTGISGLTPSIVCTPTAGATCPAELGPSMSVPTLAAGRSLIFTISALLPDTARGALVSSMNVTADGDPSLANNQASITTTVIDPRNGNYKLVATNGREYDMTIDFDAGRYEVAGNGQSLQRAFAVDSSGGGFTVAGNSRFRTATDLIVGGDDFGNGVIPYVAARKLISSVTPLNSCQVGAQYNLATRIVPPTGPATTRAGTACVANNVLQVCQSDTQPVALPQNCPAGSLRSYFLTVSDSQFTGTELTTGEKLTFRAAVSGGLLMLLGASTASDGSLQMRIGLPDAPAIAGGTSSGASTSGDWVTMTLSDVSYAVTGASGATDSATLTRISSFGGPFAMRSGLLASNNQKIFVMQASPLAVVFGDFSSGASGLMQVAVP